MLIACREVTKAQGVRTLFEGLTLTLDRGDRLGLIGPNGAGKSTLLRLLAQELTPDAGEVTAGKGLATAFVPQADAFGGAPTVRDAAVRAAAASPLMHDDHEAEVAADIVLGRLGFDDAQLNAGPGALSGGWQKKLAIARALAPHHGAPDLLLLDEPTNHLDLESIEWLEAFVRSGGFGTRPFACAFVTHDRRFLDRVAQRVLEISPAYPGGAFEARGNYSGFVRRKGEFLRQQAEQQRSLAGEVRRDAAWLGRGPQGRGTKAKGRIDASYGRMDELAELQQRNAAAVTGGARLDFDSGGRRTRKLVVARAAAKSMGGRRLFEQLDLVLGAGEVLGVLGANGSGKTTLVRVLTGELEPDAGEVVHSDPPPRVVVFSQTRRDYPPELPLREALCPVSDTVRYRGKAMHVISWSRRFLFRDEQLDQPIKTLSGGELARVHVANMMLQQADVLVLDEPTNDLDIATLETLEEAVESFDGAVLLITHDRAMMERLATRVLLLGVAPAPREFASVEQAMAARGQGPRAGAAFEPAAGSGVESGAESRAGSGAGGGSGRGSEPAGASVAGSNASPPGGKPKKLSYKDQREYDQIEQAIESAESAAAEAEAAVSDPGVLSDHARLAEACRVLEEKQAEVQRLYARWEALETLRGG